jgi:alkaline phosphatase D
MNSIAAVDSSPIATSSFQTIRNSTVFEFQRSERDSNDCLSRRFGCRWRLELAGNRSANSRLLGNFGTIGGTTADLFRFKRRKNWFSMYLPDSVSIFAKRGDLLAILLLVVLTPISHAADNLLDSELEVHENVEKYESVWNGSRRWIGPDWWANPMTDWQLKEGQAVAAAKRNRTLCFLPGDIGAKGNRFELEVTIRRHGSDAKARLPDRTAAGFRIGRRGALDDYRHQLIHATTWLDAGIRDDGHLFIGDHVGQDALPIAGSSIRLQLVGNRTGREFELELRATSGNHAVSQSCKVPIEGIVGGVSLMTDGPAGSGGRTSEVTYQFSRFIAAGNALELHAQRGFGPIAWTQYAIDRNRLRLLAQLTPLGVTDQTRVELWLKSSNRQFEKVQETQVEPFSRTAIFTLENWDLDSSREYEVRIDWEGRCHKWSGTIRKAPVPGDRLRLACFSCDNGYLFPIPAMVRQVRRQDPDMMFFAGDQIYEGYGGFGVARNVDVSLSMVDFLRKYYQFGWTWRDLLKDRPSVILTDDHDMFQGNIWGHGGRKLPMKTNKPDWRLGGYMMPAQWVTAVERCHTGHLPDPVSNTVLPIGIKPYYTELVYGGIGFAILEDRKFKTGPASLPAERQPRGEGADLLGDEQEAFLLRWSRDWDGHSMKCALSQTIFCNAATHSGQQLKRAKYFFDSNAWPIDARNRVVRILGDCNALSIHGDQHLGVLLRQGVEDFDDAGFAFMVPGTANGFPRAWWPGVEKGTPQPGADYTGRFYDDAGHPIHILAIGNPEPGSNRLPKTTDPMEIGYRKGSGYGVVDFLPKTLEATINLYRLGEHEETFAGFPKTIAIGGMPEQ